MTFANICGLTRFLAHFTVVVRLPVKILSQKAIQWAQGRAITPNPSNSFDYITVSIQFPLLADHAQICAYIVK